MSTDDFWILIARVHQASQGDMPQKCRLLETELRQLPPEEILSFAEHFTNCYHRAYTWSLWDAAFVIGGGCGDDSFMDFRSTLISMGRGIFERAVSDPESLTNANLTRETALFEGFQYVAGKVYEDVTGHEMTLENQHPKVVVGTRCDEWAMSQRYPKLTAKYGYNDADWNWHKQDAERWTKKFEYSLTSGGTVNTVRANLAELLLDAGAIPASGMIPPLRVARWILRQGAMAPEKDRTISWQPFELKEEDYWMAVVELESRTKEYFEQHGLTLSTDKLHHDYAAAKSDDFNCWIESLKARGLAK